MPLLRKLGSHVPKELALVWQMQKPDGEAIDIFVYASTLQEFDPDPAGPVGLLKRHRALLETVASQKFDRQAELSNGPLRVTIDDLSQHRLRQGGDA